MEKGNKYIEERKKELEELLEEILEANEVFENRAEFTMHIEGGRYPLCVVSFWINGDKPFLVTRFTVYLMKRHRNFQQNSIEEIRERIRTEKEKFLKYGNEN